MPTLYRVTAVTGGFLGGPGYSNFYFATDVMTESQALGASQKVGAFMTEIAPHMPVGWTFDVEGEVPEFNPTTGQLLEVFDGGAGAGFGYGTEAKYAAGVGAVLSTKSPVIHRTRRLRGRTFICPLPINSYDNQGTLDATVRSALQLAADNFYQGSYTPVIWGRPVNKTGGGWGAVSSWNVPDRVSTLRSRRI